MSVKKIQNPVKSRASKKTGALKPRNSAVTKSARKRTKTVDPLATSIGSEAVSLKYEDLVLPLSIIGRADIQRLISEIELIESYQLTAKVHAAVGSRMNTAPQVSEQLRDFLESNHLNISKDNQRPEILKSLRELKDKAPVVHMTFATPADINSLREITSWLRTNAHSQSIVISGLQPALVAGVSVRTPNRVHDLSLRSRMQEKRGVLTDELKALRGGVERV